MGAATLLRRLKPGSFVWTFDHFGIGQIASIERDLCTVRFFKSVSDEVEAVYALSRLTPAYLSPQTRAYHRDENGIWSVGRISDYVLDDHELWYDFSPWTTQLPFSQREGWNPSFSMTGGGMPLNA